MTLDYRTTTPAEIARAQSEALGAAERIVAEVMAVPAGERTYANTLKRLEDVDDLLGRTFGRYGFLAYVSPDGDVRDAAEAMREAMEKFGIELAFREDIHAAVTTLAATPEAHALAGERRRLLDFTLRDYRRNGFDLPDEQRHRIKQLKARLVEFGLAFRRNIDAYDDAILVGRDGLAGLPQSYIERLRTEERDGETRYRVGLEYPELFPFLDNAESEDLRRDLLIKSFRKGGADNVTILEEAITVRDELAGLLGYPSWAAHVLEVRMAKTPEAVHGFLADLRARMEPRRDADLDELTALKRDHTGRPDARLELWDWRFYHTRLRKQRYAVDEFEVAKYFPLEAVLDGLFDTMQTLLGVRFEPVEPANAWHPDVKLFRVVDAAAGHEIAHFFMDLFPRDNKYGHAAAFALRSGRLLADGTYQPPVSAIVANFTRPSATEPSLLRHSEVVTLFHEFGHILHQTLTRAECLRFSGSRTERDFVEAPSQMLEHWVWLPEVLGRFSRHVDSGEPLPEGLLAAMVAAKNLDAGIHIARQIFYGALDMAYHGPGVAKDTAAIARALHPITGFELPEDTYWQAGFGHLFGYDAGYYSYLWSEVFADDMFTRFEAAGPLNPALGLAYRRRVLERGGAVDGSELVRDFLGREPASDAFFKNQGLA